MALEQQDPNGDRTDVLRVELARAIRQLEDRWRVGCISAAILPVRCGTLKHHCHLPQRQLQRMASVATSPLTLSDCMWASESAKLDNMITIVRCAGCGGSGRRRGLGDGGTS